MKAGIYRDTLGNLFSVRKDRTVAAFKKTTMRDVHPMERTVYVSSRREDQAIVCSNLFDGEALRWADLPSGCQNHVTALALAIKANNEKTEQGTADLAGVEAIPGSNPFPASVGKTPTIIAISEFAEVDGAAFDRFSHGFEKGTQAFKGLTAATQRGTMSSDSPGVSNLPRAVDALPPTYRACHAQSARKHRKRGHHVIRISTGKYAWAVSP